MPDAAPERQATGCAVVLCGGPINYTHLPVGTNVSNAMIPINGRPVIGWILDDLLRKGISRVSVVTRADDERCREFLRRAYDRRMDLRVAAVSEGTIVQSLQCGLSPVGTDHTDDGPIRIVLGDTLIRDSFESSDDFVYVSSVEDSSRWCLVVTDAEGRATEYIDKQELVPGSKIALAGYYHLVNGADLRICVNHAAASGGRELSNVLRRYGKLHPIQAVEVAEWFDFGHIDGLVAARRRLIQSRLFNAFELNPILNTITKVSEIETIEDELRWYETIPEELKVLTPRIVESREVDGKQRIVQEYYGYPSLAELYVYGDISAETWMSILRHLLRIHDEFRRHRGHLPREDIVAMYVDKTWKRLAEVREQSPRWVGLLDRDEIRHNGKDLRGLTAMEDEIRSRAEALAAGAEITVVHGDFCFSNILYDMANQIVRLVDPRGSFGSPGVYGDSRYDVAKLRHSVSGLYDFIVSDMFKVEGEDGEFNSEVFADSTPSIVGEFLDQMIAAAGYDLQEIAFIEGLLFLSMLPLHDDSPGRQQMMYLTGLSRMNEVL